MRLDKFLKTMNLMKRRTVANEAAGEGFITVNGRTAKPACNLKAGDVIELDMWNFRKKIKVLQVPEKKSIPKKDLPLYIETLEYSAKTADDFADFEDDEEL
ncbi:RNA-binding S4 domain-containing protein [Geovibrio thiophilus]|uniref:RNA-binding S4 domain-containing protein n=1 Tax=Geovibrio thiophilus TaxID=139438 RepID=A0A3R5UTB0_9BACT|nr:S4 domain-containing protein [Geovibrio thiophilus]QAR31917.1 RNA-binding S4 domain-containing protein [Geovibrio thiophilus]